MKKTGIIIAVVVGLIVVAYAASPKGKDAEPADTASKAIEPVQTDAVRGESAQAEAIQTEAPAVEEPDTGLMQGEGALGDVYIKIAAARKTVDYEGNPAIVITYEFTNNGDDAENFMFSTKATVYQSDIECSAGYAAFGDDTYSSDNQLKDIKPGATLAVDAFYKLNDDTTNVEVEVGKIIDFSDPPSLVVKTFTLQ